MLEKQYYIPEPEEFMAENPLPESLKEVKRRRDEEVRAVISGRSDKMLMIVGPCSAHESAPVLEYISRLSKLNERVKEKLVLVPRIYTNKPRTKGVGYKGMFIQPDPDGAADIVRGIRSIRALHIAAMRESGLPGADEMLYPENTAYVEDLLCYHAVGARSVENQLHRLVASGIDTAVGMKNPMSGNLPALINYSGALRPHTVPRPASPSRNGSSARPCPLRPRRRAEWHARKYCRPNAPDSCGI